MLARSRLADRVVCEDVTPEQAVDEAIARIRQIVDKQPISAAAAPGSRGWCRSPLPGRLSTLGLTMYYAGCSLPVPVPAVRGWTNNERFGPPQASGGDHVGVNG